MKQIPWIDALLSNYKRSTVPIRYNYPHFSKRKNLRNFEVRKVQEAVRLGRIVYEKCREPNVIFFKMYYGKINLTYIVCVWVYEQYWEVQSTWLKHGRK